MATHIVYLLPDNETAAAIQEQLIRSRPEWEDLAPVHPPHVTIGVLTLPDPDIGRVYGPEMLRIIMSRISSAMVTRLRLGISTITGETFDRRVAILKFSTEAPFSEIQQALARSPFYHPDEWSKYTPDITLWLTPKGVSFNEDGLEALKTLPPLPSPAKFVAICLGELHKDAVSRPIATLAL